ncbi:MAG: DNA-binding domain-containing protein [Dokdonella sp.]
MSTLLELQLRVSACVLDADDRGIVDEIVATPFAGASRRLGVYVHGYRARLFEVLGNDFPGTRALAGDAEFARLCHACIEAHPSTQFNLRWYGSVLAGFLRGQTPWQERPALGAMAELEWRLGLAFDAVDEHVVDVTEMASIAADAWPGLRLCLQGSLQRQSLQWNVSAVRRAVDHDESVPALQAWDPARHWVAWRKGVTVHHRCMEDDEAAALDAVERDATFAQVCERLCEWHAIDAVAMRAAMLLRRWIEDHWVSALLTTSTP